MACRILKEASVIEMLVSLGSPLLQCKTCLFVFLLSLKSFRLLFAFLFVSLPGLSLAVGMGSTKQGAGIAEIPTEMLKWYVMALCSETDSGLIVLVRLFFSV